MASSSIKVLLIDDDDAAYIITRALLAKSSGIHYQLQWVDNYKAGLEALSSGRHDVYLIDYHLGQHNGLELMRAGINRGCTAPMILLTGLGDREIDLEAMRAGAADFLQKGEFDAPLLDRSIRYALSHQHASEMLRRREQYFRALLENTSDLITVLSRDGIVRYQSPSSRALLGRIPRDFVEQTLWQSVHPDDLPALHRAHENAWRGDGLMPCVEVRLQHMDGSWRTFEATGRTVEFRDGLDPLPISWLEELPEPVAERAMVLTLHDVSERKRAEEALQSERDFNAALLDVAGSLVVVLDCNGRIVRFNRACEAITGYRATEVQGRPFWDIFIVPEELKTVKENFAKLVAGRFPLNAENHWLTKRGTRRWITWSNTALLDHNGDTEYIIAAGIDMTARREAENALHLSESRFRSIFDNTVEGIYQIAPDQENLYANQALAGIIGFDSVEELQQQWPQVRQNLYVDSANADELIQRMNKEGQVIGFESQIRRRNGERAWVRQNARAVRDEQGQVLYYEGTISDITGRKEAEAKLRHNAFHDELTDLPNRTLFMDRLGQSLERSKRNANTFFAVLFLDFDRFKIINDSLGHMVGDELLKAIARRLEACLRPGDTVARLGGDEFAILLEDIRNDLDAIEIAERMQEMLVQPFDLSGQHIFTSASIGITIGGDGYTHNFGQESTLKAEEMLRNADMAMYRAKEKGRARHEVFDRDMHVRAVARMQLETDLRWAIERGELRLHYQPIVSLQSGQISGFEALVRWQHPERGLVQPDDFVPIAEDTGLIVKLGQWVLDEACHQMQKWKQELPSRPGLTMSVNLSSKQLIQPGLLEHIDGCLAQNSIDACDLKLEITESMIMQNAESASEMLSAAKQRGLQVAMDDFGTGYSSLSYLHQFPIDMLKIDRSFVSRIGQQGENSEIVCTIISLAHSLGLEVVAEGVETTEQMEFLRDLGCEYAQGYLFAHPAAGPQAAELLTTANYW
jgi:diguanylate cyclase (GGDEF)-like protein/PAS domain S-box-containing protein